MPMKKILKLLIIILTLSAAGAFTLHQMQRRQKQEPADTIDRERVELTVNLAY